MEYLCQSEPIKQVRPKENESLVFGQGSKAPREDVLWQGGEKKEEKHSPFEIYRMLSKENRLTKKAEFAEVLKRGRVFQSEPFGAAVLETSDQAPPRVGIIVSTKISKLATQRNRAKRLLREAIKGEIGSLAPGTKLVFLAKKAILGVGQEDVLKEVGNLIKKIK